MNQRVKRLGVIGGGFFGFWLLEAMTELGGMACGDEAGMIEDTSEVGSCGQHTDGDAMPGDEKLIEGSWWRIVEKGGELRGCEIIKKSKGGIEAEDGGHMRPDDAGEVGVKASTGQPSRNSTHSRTRSRSRKVGLAYGIYG